MKKKSTTKKKLTASKLRIILSSSLVLIILGMAGSFYLAYSFLRDTSKSVSEARTEAESSDAKLQHLLNLQTQLDTHKESVDKAQRIVAESQSYQYQNQIIADLTHYAGKAGISIVSFTFQDTPSGDTSQGSTTPAPSATPPAAEGTPAEGGDVAAPGDAGGEAGTEGSPAAAPAGPKSTQVAIQLGSGVEYTSLLHFVHLIEQNLTRMQVADLTLSGGGEESGDMGSQSLNIEVYIK